MLSYVVGKRDAAHTEALAADLRARILNRPQITSDGFSPYIDAIDAAFGLNVDFAQLVKTYQGGDSTRQDAAHRYSPGTIRSITKTVITGDPHEDRISTSYVERFNLTTRMQMRRFTRLTNGFSKKIENHVHMVALYTVFYNFTKVHKTLRVTPAMEAGLTDRVWDMIEIVEMIEEVEREAMAAALVPATQG